MAPKEQHGPEKLHITSLVSENATVKAKLPLNALGHPIWVDWGRGSWRGEGERGEHPPTPAWLQPTCKDVNRSKASKPGSCTHSGSRSLLCKEHPDLSSSSEAACDTGHPCIPQSKGCLLLPSNPTSLGANALFRNEGKWCTQRQVLRAEEL